MWTVAKFCGVLLLLILMFSGTKATDGQEQPLNCTEIIKADFYCLLDSSGSIAVQGWARAKNFTVNLARAFKFGSQNVRWAFGIFSTQFVHKFNLNAFDDIDAFAEAVQATSQLKELTYTDVALTEIISNKYLFDPKLGARDGVGKHLFLITDGQSNFPNLTIAAAEALRRLGVIIHAVGVGMINQTELLGIASDQNNVFSVKSYGVVEAIKPQIVQKVCDEPSTPPAPGCPASFKHDIVIVIDSTVGVGSINNAKSFEFAGAVVEKFQLGEDKAKIGIVIFSSTALVIASLTSSKPAIYDALVKGTYQNGTVANADLALKAAQDQLINAGRPGVNKTIIFLTRGKSADTEKTLLAAYDAKIQSINIITIGILPDADCKELSAASSRPEYFISAESYILLASYANIVAELTCYAPPPPKPLPVPRCVDTVADIYILFDGSNSINSVGWGRELAFISNFSKAYPYGPNAVQYAFGQFSTDFVHVANLNTYPTQEEFSKAILGQKQLKQVTYTWDAINGINSGNYLFDPSKGARDSAQKVLFVITDGNSQDINKTIAAAKEIRNKHVTIIALTVGVVNPVEIQGIAGNEKNVFSVKTFGAIESIKPFITKRICEAKSDLPTEKLCPASYQNDIVFVIDSSRTIGSENYLKSAEFVSAAFQKFSMDNSATRIAVVTFSSTVQVVFDLTESENDIYENLVNIPYQNGDSTNTDEAIRTAHNLLTANSRRAGTNKTIVLVTSGKSSDTNKTFAAADEAKSDKVNIIVCGIGTGVDSNELNAVASRPQYFNPASSYVDLVQLATRVAETACNAPPPPPPVKPCPPVKKVDMVFVVDSSGSIGLDNYRYNFLFISRLLAGFYLGEDGTKVALCTFGTNTKPRFSFSGDKDFVEQQLPNIPYQNSTTNTHKALRYVKTLVNDPTSGARSGVLKVAIVITDGLSTDPDETVKAANELKEAGITAIALGVGSYVDYLELNAIASKPEYVKLVGDYSILENFASTTAEIICDQSQAATTT